MFDLPEEIEWPGHGVAKFIQPRGMDDIRRIFRTEDGAVLRYSALGWQAQYKNITTRWKSTPSEAIDAYERVQPQVR